MASKSAFFAKLELELNGSCPLLSVAADSGQGRSETAEIRVGDWTWSGNRLNAVLIRGNERDDLGVERRPIMHIIFTLRSASFAPSAAVRVNSVWLSHNG
jgi:hypothetical protein